VPGLTFNTHRIRVEGEFGSLQIQVENVPSENPRTGRLSYLSTIALLRDLGATQRHRHVVPHLRKHIVPTPSASLSRCSSPRGPPRPLGIAPRDRFTWSWKSRPS